jgi:hypothetical protein
MAKSPSPLITGPKRGRAAVAPIVPAGGPLARKPFAPISAMPFAKQKFRPPSMASRKLKPKAPGVRRGPI